jgi:hypothetical protein
MLDSKLIQTIGMWARNVLPGFNFPCKTMCIQKFIHFPYKAVYSSEFMHQNIAKQISQVAVCAHESNQHVPSFKDIFTNYKQTQSTQ